MRPGQELTATAADWATTALAVPLAYTAHGRNLAWAALAGAPVYQPLAHHPRRDVRDPRHGTRFYYHGHESARTDGPEHGHFHLFAEGSAPGDYTHLAALSLDDRGQPLRWFTTNGWVTGERWRPAAQVLPGLQRFQVHTPGRLAPVARWLTAMVQLFQDDLAALLHARDAELARLGPTPPSASTWADRRWDVLSSCPAALGPRLQALGLT